MYHYVIVCEVIDLSLSRGPHRHIEVIRETLDEAIDEIEYSRSDDPLILKYLEKEVFHGRIGGEGCGRKFLYTFETKGGLQVSYIVYEIEESDITRNAIVNGRYDGARELLEELY